MSFWCHCFDQNSNKNIVSISALKFFVASWGLPGSFLGLPGDLVSNIINKEAYRNPKKLLGSPKEAKKLSGQISLQYFCCYFGPNNDTKKTFRNYLTIRKRKIFQLEKQNYSNCKKEIIPIRKRKKFPI